MDDQRRFEELQKTLQNSDRILEMVNKVAQADNHLSEDESRILDKLVEDLRLYKHKLRAALENSTVTKEEYLEIKNFENRIMANALHIAGRDGVVTEEEKNMLNELIFTFRRIRE